jgi:hypothetical protein
MPRIPKIQAEAARSVESLVDPAKKRRKKGAPTRSYVRRLIVEAAERRRSDDWDGAKPRHLVALYLILHSWCYGVEAEEVVGVAWNAAVSAAGKLLRDEFDDKIEEAVEFIRWVWKRERGREKWRRENGGGGGGRVGWRLMFAQRSFVTDYRVALHREQKGAD